MKPPPPAISLVRRLMVRLLAGGLLLGLALAASVGWLVTDQTRELLDYQLEQVARVLIDHDFNRLDVPLVDDPAAHLSVQVLDAAGKVLYRSGDQFRIPVNTTLGFSRQLSRQDEDGDPELEEVWLRVFTLRSEQRTVQVTQPRSLRREIVWGAAVRVMLPFAAVLGLMLGLVWFAVHTALAPLRRLQAELARRDADALTPIALPDAPAELQQPLAAINGLLQRLQDSLDAHRHFIGDAAHQLRTPLAAVRLQCDNLMRAPDGAARLAAQRRLDQGLVRLSRLVDQLLALARLENSRAGTHTQDMLDLGTLATESLMDLVVVAAQRGSELDLVAPSPVRVAGDATALRMLIDNLVDNALKYSPPGGLVRVAVDLDQGRPRLRVSDQGPGIAAADRERVLARFARAHAGAQTGSGLGLAIVAEVARQHGAQLALDSGESGSGLCVSVSWPPASATV